MMVPSLSMVRLLTVMPVWLGQQQQQRAAQRMKVAEAAQQVCAGLDSWPWRQPLQAICGEPQKDDLTRQGCDCLIMQEALCTLASPIRLVHRSSSQWSVAHTTEMRPKTWVSL